MHETRQELLDAVRKKPGRSGAEYDGMLRLSEGQAVRHLKALEREGLIRREGQRRGTRWFPGEGGSR
jgi:predicted ArsR family transcriptional regulator